MEVLELRVQWSGYYGTDVDEYMILPINWNGKLTEELEVGKYSNEVYLGEIEGKHSEVYGNLIVEIKNLSELKYIELIDYLNGSDSSSFESYLENMEELIYDDLDEDESSTFDENKSKYFKLIGYIPEYEHSIHSVAISELFVENLLNRNKVSTEVLIIKSEDYSKTIQLLLENNIDTF